LQVVDARDPLTYRSEDLERYAVALHPAKRSLLLLNKADLLPEGLRSAWADHFDGLGVEYLFWSAKAAMDEHSTGAVGSVGAVRGGNSRGARMLP
jgi:large subunit GTPase 1